MASDDDMVHSLIVKQIDDGFRTIGVQLQSLTGEVRQINGQLQGAITAIAEHDIRLQNATADIHSSRERIHSLANLMQKRVSVREIWLILGTVAAVAGVLEFLNKLHDWLGPAKP
jgi:hypothetical protein